MVVRSNLSLVAVLGLALTGCAGNLLVGVTPDGGDELDGQPGEAGDAGGLDAKVADAGSSSGGKEAGPAPASEAGPATGNPAGDASTPSAANDAGSSAPPLGAGRDLSTDKTKFAGSPRCSNSLQFCDDFEQTVGAMPGQAWSYPYGFMPKIDTTHAMRGTRALLFTAPAGTPAVIEEAITFPATNNTIFGRMFVWIEGLPTAPNNAAFTLVSASGTGNMTEVRFGGQLDTAANRGKNYYGVGSNGGESGDWRTPGTEAQSVAIEKAWTCLEWMFKGDSSETRIWIDGTEQASLHTTSTEYRPGDAEGGKKFVHPTFTKMRIGWWWYDASNAAPTTTNLWIDEVAFDKDRIGCVL